MKIYLAGPMRGVPFFNFPAFKAAAKKLREEGHTVFNPAERDEQTHGIEVSNSPTGNLEDVKHVGFNLREAMAADTAYICLQADTIAMLPGWERSKGATAELALAQALGHNILFLGT